MLADVPEDAHIPDRRAPFERDTLILQEGVEAHDAKATERSRMAE